MPRTAIGSRSCFALRSTHADNAEQTVALADYVGRMKAGQDAIYYVTADGFAAATHSPHLEVFRKNGVEVLLLTDRVDEWVVSHLTEFDGKKLQSAAQGDLDVSKLGETSARAAELEEGEFKDLLARMREVLKDRASQVRLTHRLTDSPACLVSDEHAMGRHLERILRESGQRLPTSRPIFEINPDHPIVQRLKQESDETLFADWSHILFDQALLAEGAELDDSAVFVKRLNKLMLALAGGASPRIWTPANQTPGPAENAMAGAPSATLVREQLGKLLSSAQLANAERLSSLLRFIVEETLNGHGSQLKEARIGLDVFGRRPDSYDPAIDPIVRVQMGRLRIEASRVLQAAGAADHVRIDIPVGSYVPVFETARGGLPWHGQSARRRVADDLRIAVLPIVNMSPEAGEPVLLRRTHRGAHQPPGADSSASSRRPNIEFSVQGRGPGHSRSGQLLDVSKVLEGSVRKAGNRIRVTVQLINVADGCHLWSERYEGDLTDIFAIHEQISTAVQRALQMKMLGDASPPVTRRRAAGARILQPLSAGAFPLEEKDRAGPQSRS